MKKLLIICTMMCMVHTHLEAKRWLYLKNQTKIPDQAFELVFWYTPSKKSMTKMQRVVPELYATIDIDKLLPPKSNFDLVIQKSPHIQLAYDIASTTIYNVKPNKVYRLVLKEYSQDAHRQTAHIAAIPE